MQSSGRGVRDCSYIKVFFLFLCLASHSQLFSIIHRCILKEDDPLLAGLDIHFFSREKQTFDIVDMTSVWCLIGRVKAGGGSQAIIDRSGKLAHAKFEEQGAKEEDLVSDLILLPIITYLACIWQEYPARIRLDVSDQTLCFYSGLLAFPSPSLFPIFSLLYHPPPQWSHLPMLFPDVIFIFKNIWQALSCEFLTTCAREVTC